jgi:hypothetical protein
MEDDIMRSQKPVLKITQFCRIAACVLLAGVAACTLPMIEVQQVIETRSCTDDAVAMTVLVETGGVVTSVNYEGGSANVLGIPLVMPAANTVFLVADLDDADMGEAVTLKYSARVLAPGVVEVGVTDIEFYKASWFDGAPPDCAPSNGPEFQIALSPLGDLNMHLKNPGPDQLTIVMLELAETNLLPPSSLDWDDPAFNALSWHAAVPGGTMLDSGAPPMEIDLPDVLTSGGAAVCRFITVCNGQELRGIMQADLTGQPIDAAPATWGQIKALYR